MRASDLGLRRTITAELQRKEHESGYELFPCFSGTWGVKKDTCFLSYESYRHSVSQWGAILQLKMNEESGTVVCLHVQMVAGAKQLCKKVLPVRANHEKNRVRNQGVLFSTGVSLSVGDFPNQNSSELLHCFEPE